MEKQDLQSGERSWQNYNSTINYIQKQKTKKYDIMHRIIWIIICYVICFNPFIANFRPI